MPRDVSGIMDEIQQKADLANSRGFGKNLGLRPEAAGGFWQGLNCAASPRMPTEEHHRRSDGLLDRMIEDDSFASTGADGRIVPAAMQVLIIISTG